MYLSGTNCCWKHMAGLVMLRSRRNWPGVFSDATAVRRLSRAFSMLLAMTKKVGSLRAKVANILAADPLSLTDAEFLVEKEQVDAVETYVLDRVNQLNGDYYDSLLRLAEVMEIEGHQLAATAIYRALPDSILSRARSKAYWHGAHHLKELDKLASSISDWRNLEDHAIYSENLRQTHGRKRSFWSRYES